MKQISILLILCFLLIPVTLISQIEEKEFLTEIGDNVPAFEVNSIDGTTFNSKDFKGKVVLINFFATWCPPCLAEMPHLENEIWQKYKSDDFIVLALGREHTKEELVKFNNEKKFTFFIAPDTGRVVFSKFADKSIPRNYLIDRNGKIAYQAIGYTEEEFEVLIKKVEKLLKK